MSRRHTGGMATYAVIGVGGVGGFYGINLASGGAEVHFLIRSGYTPGEVLRLSSPRGDQVLTPGRDCQVHSDWGTIPKVDVAIVAVKTTANADLAPRVASIVRPGGAVVVLQNGIGAEPGYAAAVPGDVEVIGGLAFLASYRASPTRFVHIDYGALTLGRYLPGFVPGGVTDAMRRLAADLEPAGVPVVPANDLLAARWQKLVWNVPFNGLSVVLDARTDELVASPATRALIGQLMAEVIAGARADGRELPAELPEQMLVMTDAMKPYAPSMKLDYDHGRPLEVAALYRAAIARAAHGAVAMPGTAMLAAQLEFLDARAQAAGTPLT
jgi:2-dehydropantoate 2-reductase